MKNVPARTEEPAPFLRDSYIRLLRAYGPQGWWPARTRFEVLVGAILTQNTGWTGVELAIDRLRRHGALAPARLLALTPARLAAVVRPAGCPRVKSRRLRTATAWLVKHGGFRALDRIPTAELRPMLLSCHGIGPETADSLLLYALDRPVFVVDAYTRRILTRHELLAGDESYAGIQRLFHHHLRPDARRFGEFHALLVRLAKTCCRKRNPDCRSCPLAD